MAKCDFLTAEVSTAAGEKVPIEGIYDEENSTFSILLTNQLTVEGAISFQLVGYVTEYDTAEPQIIAKSPLVSGFITQGINGIEAEADSNPNLLARIWAKIREWADKIHTHDNYWSLSDLHCVASEVEQGGNNPFPILPNYVGVDRPTYRGNYLSYCSDGAVIGKVEEKDDGEKFLRLWLYKGPSDYNFDVPDFIDIPVKAINEKVEDFPSIGTNGAGVEVDLGVGSGGGGSVEIDTTLTKKGEAADAKATGDRFAERYTKQEIDDKGFATTSQMTEYVTAAINGSLDEIEAMIDESGVLDE